MQYGPISCRVKFNILFSKIFLSYIDSNIIYLRVQILKIP
jgi:hypothetical protein